MVKTFGDLLKDYDRAEVTCLYTGKLVRRLSKTPKGDIVLDPMVGPTLVVAPNTPILFEPWEMDRGSLIFNHPDMPGKTLKLCGEGDRITFQDGVTRSIHPHPSCEKHPHIVEMRVCF